MSEAIASAAVCAVIVTYLPEAEVAENLAALAPQVGHILVVDNGSPPKHLPAVQAQALHCGATLMRLDRNLGIAAALSIGLDFARQKGFTWLATFDQDSRAPPTMIEEMLRCLATYPRRDRVGLVAPLHIDRKSGVRIGDRATQGAGDGWRLVRTAMTSGNLVNVAAALEVGGFDDGLFIDYVDHEFCLRLRQHGYQVLEATRALLIHSLGALEVRRLGPLRLLITHYRPARRYYMSRNRILVWKKYWRREPGWLLQDARRLVVEFIGVVLYEKDVSSKLRMALRGFRDALRNVRGELRP